MKTFVLMMVSLLFAISSEAQNKSFYDFTVKTIDGKDFPLSSLKGKKVLVVNVASKCGLTPQYAQLEKLYEKYKEKDFVVIYRDWETDRKSTRLNSSHITRSRMPSSA